KRCNAIAALHNMKHDAARMAKAVTIRSAFHATTSGFGSCSNDPTNSRIVQARLRSLYRSGRPVGNHPSYCLAIICLKSRIFGIKFPQPEGDLEQVT
ncbi:MAG: hypothetical protein WAK33_22515, partial [Silvibacterium sp.]